MQTWIATPMFKVKNRSMQKKAGIRTYCGSTTWFCEPWPVQPVHTIPLFQALNGTVGLSSLFFFFPYDVVWAYEHTRETNRNLEILASLSQISITLWALYLSLTTHSLNYLSHLCLSPSSPSATTLCPDRNSLSQSLSASLSLCLVTVTPNPTWKGNFPFFNFNSPPPNLISTLLLQGTLSFLILLSFMSIYIFWPIFLKLSSNISSGYCY